MDIHKVEVKVAGFLDNSLVNGEGMRSVLFVSGCYHNCDHCHNKEMQNFEYGDSISMEAILNRIEDNIPLIKGVTFSGGEPFEQAQSLYLIGKQVKALGLNIWCYTGYTFEEILENRSNAKGWQDLLECVDILVDGKFETSSKVLNLKFRGSSNQRIIDVKESLINNKVIEKSI